MNNRDFDIIVLGGGHAGVEAAWIAEQFGLRVAIITMPGAPIASAPCNPAIGGVGKGQVVREIDALGGLMGRMADLGAIQFRVLNESRGAAVQSTRAQIDKEKYALNAERIISEETSIEIIREKAEAIAELPGSIEVKTTRSSYKTAKLIVTTGTFLGGKLHTGSQSISGGRVGIDASSEMSSLFSKISVGDKRFKTGTPARLRKSGLNYSKMEEQPSDPNALNFHLWHDPRKRFLDQKSCFLTRTTKRTMDLVRESREKSPLFNGQITGVGPRYCPSIEDKAFRYPDRFSHHVFIEPEGIDLDTIYPNGLSTSLPIEIQEEFYRTVEGLEKAEIEIPGYAVEYDVVDTAKLDETLASIDVSGVYFAGQINGTSGYEEAAGQGIIAGANAALSFLNKDPLVLSPSDSYIGVMINDLTTSSRDEPYRLFTARAENRLYIREDNAFLRMRKYRSQLGIKAIHDVSLELLEAEYSSLNSLITQLYIDNSQNDIVQKFGAPIGAKKILLTELIKSIPHKQDLFLALYLKSHGLHFSSAVIRAAAITCKYSGYIERSEQKWEKLNKLGSRKIQWESLLDNKNISNECRQRIESVRPMTFRQLQSIEGIRPATLAYVAGRF